MPAPTPEQILEELEGYGIDASIISESWLKRRRDRFVLPYIESVTRQSFQGTKQTDEHHSGTGSSIIVLNRRPVISLDAVRFVHLNTNPISLSTLVLLPDEGIVKVRVGGDEVRVEQQPTFPRGRRNIVITYTYGFADLPDDVSQAVIYWTAERALAQIANRTGGGAISTQGFSRQYGDMGKYSDARKQLARDGWASLRRYITGVAGV